MQEREKNNLVSLIFLRRDVAAYYTQPTPTQVADTRRWLEALYETSVPNILSVNPELYQSQLSQLKQRVILETGKVPSRAKVVVTLLKGIFANYMENLVGEAEKSGDKPKFASCFDVYTGARLVLENIELGIDANEGVSETSKTKLLTNVEEAYDEHGAPISLGDSANAYVKLNALYRKTGRLLREDPSGFLIIDDCVDRISAYSADNPTDTMQKFQIKEFVLAGAEFAQRFYKAIYNIPENIERRALFEKADYRSKMKIFSQSTGRC